MIAGQGQTVMDVAVERSGTAEAAWDIAVRSGVNLTDAVAGTTLDVPSVAADPDTVEALSAAGARPATDGSTEQYEHRAIGVAIIGTDRIC